MSRIISTHNQKAKLAADYNELLKELSSSEMTSIGYYKLGETIGEGSFGKVKIGTHKLTGQRVAIKRIHKKHVPMIAREIHHHRRLRHPNIVTLYEIIITESFIHVISEYCPGGELFDVLASCGRCPEQRARKWFRQLVSAIKYCHAQGVVHRDLKLENILLDAHDNAKLCDFGFARQADHRQLLETFCGSLAYSAPEVIERRKYCGPETDIWSLAVVLYTLLAGELPFDDDSEIITQKKIVRVAYEIPYYFPPGAAELIRSMLQKNPSDRLTLEQISTHSWVQQSDHEDIVLDEYSVNLASRSSSFTHNSSHSDDDSLFSVGQGRFHDEDDTCTEISSSDSYSSDHRPLTPKTDRLISQAETFRFSPQVRSSLGINTRPPRSLRFSAPTTSKSPLLPSLDMTSQRSSLPNVLPSHKLLSEYSYRHENQPMTAKELHLAAALTAAGVDQDIVKKMRITGTCDSLNGLWNMLLEKTNDCISSGELESGSPVQDQQKVSADMPRNSNRAQRRTENACTQTDIGLRNGIHAGTQTVVSEGPHSRRPRISPRTSSNSAQPMPNSLGKQQQQQQQQAGWLTSAVKSWFSNKPTNEPKCAPVAQQLRGTSKPFRNVDAPLPHKEGRRYWDHPTLTTEQQEQQQELYRSQTQRYRLHSLQLSEPPVAQVDQLAYNSTQFGPADAVIDRPRPSTPRYSIANPLAQENLLSVPPLARTLVKPAPLVDVEKRYSCMAYSAPVEDLVSVPPVAASSGTTVQHNENKQMHIPVQLHPPSPALSESTPSSVIRTSGEKDGEEGRQDHNNASLPLLSSPPSEPSFNRQIKTATHLSHTATTAMHSKRSEFMPRSRLNVYGMINSTSINSFASRAIIEEAEEEEEG
ncbi:kinase-like domain-containing protein [Dichotomocladium elegans]|nr:kinase-like domain-containing protein [Dichotomocladium elegans]